MKNKRWHNYIWRILCIAILLLVMPASGTTQAQEVDGYWKLISVDVEKKPQSSGRYFIPYNISRGTGTSQS